jgi:glutathione S-transferase
MIVLHQFARNWGIPNQSHFCVKVETYLRLAQLPYTIVESLPFKGPRGKLPFIEDQGRTVADSRLIVHYLQTTYGDALDAGLTPKQRDAATVYRRLLEEHLYWVSMYSRWNYTEANWQTTKQAIFSVLPPVVADLGALAYRRRIKGQILGHGIGRLSPEEAFALGREDLDALSGFLGDKPYFLGEKPSDLDASAYGILINTLGCPVESPVKDHALSKRNLVEYCRRMQTEYFPELACPLP